jgi:nitrite reductase/ring-hydroxylating ferredoxin subunit/DMSO/TMAO reductase YedYZ heme-binding membrane subunit
MSVEYRAILWNRQKKIYDAVVASGVAMWMLLFVGAGAIIHPNATAETLLIRAFGTASLFLLHVVLAIGPLCRLSSRFLPLLYNRRHLGVTMFLLALAHGVFATVQFHAFGNTNPIVSVLTANTQFKSVANFPFQQLGLAATIILFLMAVTSHDFWLHTLTPRVWKRLHMLVYVAYVLLVGHVLLGALQSERNPILPVLLSVGITILVALHLAAGVRELRTDRAQPQEVDDGFVDVCGMDAIPEKRAVVVSVGAERVAVFRYDGKISAVSNVCRHQNGPLGEGRIIDGCITCPWHGYQYRPDDGTSPPPFNDKVETYRTRIHGTRVQVHPCALAPGTPVPPSQVAGPEAVASV